MELLQTVNENFHGLKLTPAMYRQARGNKMHFIVTMHPEDFLKLTTNSKKTTDIIKKECKKLEDYNRWADEGETIIMPSLWIEKGKVKSHEGRHRAAASICAGNYRFPVAIRIYPEKEHQEKYGYFEAKYQIKFEDLPEYIYGQHGSGIVNKSDIDLVIDGWDTLTSDLTEAKYVTKFTPEEVFNRYVDVKSKFFDVNIVFWHVLKRPPETVVGIFFLPHNINSKLAIRDLAKHFNLPYTSIVSESRTPRTIENRVELIWDPKSQ